MEIDDEEKIVKTACRACIANCGVLAHVKNGRVIRLEGNPVDPMSQGRMCAKGLSGIQALYHPNRTNIRCFVWESVEADAGEEFHGMRR